jgi:hypothetical protein
MKCPMDFARPSRKPGTSEARRVSDTDVWILRLAWCAVALLPLACGAPPLPQSTSAPSPIARTPSEPAVVTAGELAAGECEGGEGIHADLPATVDLTCGPIPYQNCRTTALFTVTNCDGQPVEVLSIDIHVIADSDMGYGVEFKPFPVVGPNQQWSYPLTIRNRGASVFVVTVRSAGQDATREVLASSVVTNKALDEATAKCEACRGNWGRHGLSGRIGCICRTNDHGRRCDDGQDCEGACLGEKFEVVEPAKPMSCTAAGCTATLGLYRPVGRCSEWTRGFGCRWRIADGASKRPPTGSRRGAPSCRD